MQTYYFATLFDSGFLSKGLALYRSLERHIDNFELTVLCLDDESYRFLKGLNESNLKPILLSDFENKELKEIKKTRSFKEYCFTLSPHLLKHLIQDRPMITYLDADLFFYSSPKDLYNELDDGSVYIIPHRRPLDERAQEEKVGKYNVGLIIFKNNENGRACLNWWKEKCDEWCYHRAEPGRYADQKYLDYFEQHFEGVRVSEHKGADLAPWNLKTFRDDIMIENGKVVVQGYPLVFFHFAKYEPYDTLSRWRRNTPSKYYNKWGRELSKYVFEPYAHALADARIEIESAGYEAKNFAPRPPWWKDVFVFSKRILRKLLKFFKN